VGESDNRWLSTYFNVSAKENITGDFRKIFSFSRFALCLYCEIVLKTEEYEDVT